jgi:hypothetical protein
MSSKRRNLLLFFFFSAMALLLWGHIDEARAKFSLKNTWQRTETKHTIIQYQSFEDLKDFDDNISFSSGGSLFGNLFSSSDSNNPAGSLAKKLDSLYERVQQILDMRGNLKKVRINIYSNSTKLHEIYRNIVGGECRVRAWYIFEVNTIYINNEDIDSGMLAHEMAHSIIDHFFAVRPPEASAEILAVYVDQHLED